MQRLVGCRFDLGAARTLKAPRAHEQVAIEALQRIERLEWVLEDRLHLPHEIHPRAAAADGRHVRTEETDRTVGWAREVQDHAHGAVSVFLGVVRDTNLGREVAGIEYAAYEGMAARELEHVAAEASARFGVQALVVEHRIGTLVLGEIRKGIELARARDPHKAAALEGWLRQVEVAFGGRVLGIDGAVSDQWGRMSAIRPIPVVDGLLAATAMVSGLTFVTRNDRNVAGLGAAVLNPFLFGDDRR